VDARGLADALTSLRAAIQHLVEQLDLRRRSTAESTSGHLGDSPWYQREEGSHREARLALRYADIHTPRALDGSPRAHERLAEERASLDARVQLALVNENRDSRRPVLRDLDQTTRQLAVQERGHAAAERARSPGARTRPVCQRQEAERER